MLRLVGWTLVLLAVTLAVILGVRSLTAPAPLLDVQHVHAITADAGRNAIWAATLDGLYYGADWGKRWQRVAGLGGTDVMGLSFGAGPDILYAHGHYIGVMYSDDGGQSWQPRHAGLPDLDVHGLSVHPEDPAQLLAYVVGHGVYASTDGGVLWQPLAGPLTQLQDVLALTHDPHRPQIVYAAGIGGLSVSSDGGRTWSESGIGVRDLVVKNLAPTGTPGDLLAAVSRHGLVRSSDGGANWRPLGRHGIPQVAAVARDSARGHLWVANDFGALYVSRDDGRTWRRR